jgi:pimeloyl-ACP methyl ester carboxylesterase
MSLQPITFTEFWADRGPHRIRLRDYPGNGPAIVLMHGFPDDKHLYDRMLPYLTGRRRVVTLTSSAGASPTSRPATPTPRPTRRATSTP